MCKISGDNPHSGIAGVTLHKTRFISIIEDTNGCSFMGVIPRGHVGHVPLQLRDAPLSPSLSLSLTLSHTHTLTRTTSARLVGLHDALLERPHPEACHRWGLAFEYWGGCFGFGFGVWGLGFGVEGLGFGVWGLGFGVDQQGRGCPGEASRAPEAVPPLRVSCQSFMKRPSILNLPAMKFPTQHNLD